MYQNKCKTREYDLIFRRWSKAAPVAYIRNGQLTKLSSGNEFTVAWCPLTQLTTNPIPGVEINLSDPLSSSSTGGSSSLSTEIGNDQQVNIDLLRIDIVSGPLQVPINNAHFEIEATPSSDYSSTGATVSWSFNVNANCAPGNMVSIFMHMPRITSNGPLNTTPFSAVVAKNSTGTVTGDVIITYTNLPAGSSLTFRNVYPGSDDWSEFLESTLFTEGLYITKDKI